MFANIECNNFMPELVLLPPNGQNSINVAITIYLTTYWPMLKCTYWTPDSLKSQLLILPFSCVSLTWWQIPLTHTVHEWGWNSFLCCCHSVYGDQINFYLLKDKYFYLGIQKYYILFILWDACMCFVLKIFLLLRLSVAESCTNRVGVLSWKGTTRPTRECMCMMTGSSESDTTKIECEL